MMTHATCPVQDFAERDTVVLMRGSGDSFAIESNFVDYTGAFAQHGNAKTRS